MLFLAPLLGLLARAGSAIGIRGLGAEAAATVAKSAPAASAAAKPVVDGSVFNTLRSGMRSATQLFGEVGRDGIDMTLARRLMPKQAMQGNADATRREKILREVFPQQMEARDRTEAAPFINYGALMGQMGNPNAMASAMSQAKADAASAKAEQESIKREHDSAKAAGELADSLRTLRRSAMTAFGAGIGLYYGMKKFGEYAEDRGRTLAPFSASIMRESVRLDVQRLRHEVMRARGTEATASWLLRSTYQFREHVRPIEQLGENIANIAGVAGMSFFNYGRFFPNLYSVAYWGSRIVEALGGGSKPSELGMDVMMSELITGRKRDGRGSFHADGKPLSPPPNWNRPPF